MTILPRGRAKSSPFYALILAVAWWAVSTTSASSVDDAESYVGVASAAVDADGTVREAVAASGEDIPISSTCADEEEDEDDCAVWAQRGECETNPDYMLLNCRKSCFACIPPLGEMDLGVEQVIEEESEEKTLEVIRRAELYMRDEVYVKPEYRSVRLICKNQDEHCASWAAEDECDKNPGYMRTHCAPVCRTCGEVGYESKCPLDPDAADAVGPGDLDALFERITDQNDPEYASWLNPTVLSRPGRPDGAAEEEADYRIGPWVVIFDGFLSPDECDRLIELGMVEGYERSTDVGALQVDGSHGSLVSKGRTSKNAWCVDECYEDPVAQKVMERIVNLTGFPETNSENLQLLRYTAGQFYVTHHDFIEDDVDRQPGPRILTLYLYLNDVEAGGGTNFPDLDLTVMPKKGRALLWPNALDEDPNSPDPRTDHQALPVERGVKYGANAWLHLRDFKGPNDADCA